MILGVGCAQWRGPRWRKTRSENGSCQSWPAGWAWWCSSCCWQAAGQAPVVHYVTVAARGFERIDYQQRQSGAYFAHGRARRISHVCREGCGRRRAGVHRGQLILTLDAATFARNSRKRARICLPRNPICATRAPVDRPTKWRSCMAILQKARGERREPRTNATSPRTAGRQASRHAETKSRRTRPPRASARHAGNSAAEESRARATRCRDDAERAGLRVKQAQDQVQLLEEKVRSATVIAPVRRHALLACPCAWAIS